MENNRKEKNQDTSNQVNTDELPYKPRLNKKHGFLREIQRVQYSRDEYEKEWQKKQGERENTRATEKSTPDKEKEPTRPPTTSTPPAVSRPPVKHEEQEEDSQKPPRRQSYDPSEITRKLSPDTEDVWDHSGWEEQRRYSSGTPRGRGGRGSGGYGRGDGRGRGRGGRGRGRGTPPRDEYYEEEEYDEEEISEYSPKKTTQYVPKNSRGSPKNRGDSSYYEKKKTPERQDGRPSQSPSSSKTPDKSSPSKASPSGDSQPKKKRESMQPYVPPSRRQSSPVILILNIEVAEGQVSPLQGEDPLTLATQFVQKNKMDEGLIKIIENQIVINLQQSNEEQTSAPESQEPKSESQAEEKKEKPQEKTS